MAEKLLSGSGSGKQFAAQQLLALMNEMPGGFFIYRAYGEHIAAKYGAAHLEPVDGLFNDDPVVVQKRQLHRGVQF